MKIHDYIDMDELNRALERGLVSSRPHPRWPLSILNYTSAAMTKTHDNPTLRRCRGLIFDHVTREVVVRPMEAFFNINDTRYPETMLENMPRLQDANLEITEKRDGSLGVVYQYQNNPPEVATRGSFTSDQAKWATEYFQAHNEMACFRGVTPLVEIIYPENQIVVDYKDEQSLTLLTLIDNETGSEMTHGGLEVVAVAMGIPVVKLWNKSVAQCAAENEKNREGYVAKFISRSGQVQRFKIKFEDYKLCHRAMFGMNNRDVWESLKDGKQIDLTSIAKVAPQGLVDWLMGEIAQFTVNFEYIKSTVIDLHGMAHRGVMNEDWKRKDVAAFFNRQCVSIHPSVDGGRTIPLAPVLFAAFDGKDYTKVIWKLLRPARAEGYRTAPIEEAVDLAA